MNRAIHCFACAILLSLCVACLPGVAFGVDDAAESEADSVLATPTGEPKVPVDATASGKVVEGKADEADGVFQRDGAASEVEQADDQVELAVAAADDVQEGAFLVAADVVLEAQDSSKDAALATGVYTIVSATGSSKCLDVPGGSSAEAVGLQIYTQNVTAAQRWAIRALGSGLYEIVNAGSGKALDVAGGRKADGVTVQQFTRNNTAAQKWKIVSSGSGQFKIVSALSDAYVLDVSGGSKNDGARVQIWSDNGTKAQRWSIVSAKVLDDGFYVVKNSKSNKALDVSGGSLNNSANVQQYDANGTAAQTFQLSYNSSNGYYTITDLGSGKVLDVAGGSSKRGANVQQYTPNGTRAQQWAASKNTDGTYTFRSAVSGLALDVSGASFINGANVQVWDANGTVAQKWTLSGVNTWITEGTYTLAPAVNTANALDISGGSTSNGANVQQYSANATNAQRFFLRSMGGGYFAIQNPVSGKYLNVTSKSSGGNVVLGTTQQQFKPVFGVGGVTFQLKDDTSLVLDISGASTNSGANVQLYKSNGTLAQKFAMKSTDMFAEGTYSIRYAANSDYVLDVPGASSDDGKQLQLYESNGTAAQRFALKRVAANTYQITASCSGKALQIAKASDGTYQLQQRAVSNSSDQQWVVVLGADGPSQFAPKSNSGMRIDLKSGTVANATSIIVYASNDTAAQKWKLVLAKESTVYDVLGLTLRRMAELQKASEYNTMSVNELMDLLNPDKLDKTQFLDLRTVTSATADQLNAFITSTSTGQSGVLKGLGSSFVSAAKQCGLNEVYLLAHAILESGWGTSELARGYYYGGGTIDGTYYPAGTYYNFYGIGAYDSSPLSGGRKLAIINGWNSREKAVTGAAQWIARNYVYASSYAQPTLYAMKWDYARSNATGERGWHQYATSTSWPDSIARLISQCYARIGGNPNQIYVVPRYK